MLTMCLWLAGIRMNAGHLILGYMPPFQAILFPVHLRPCCLQLPCPWPHVLLYGSQACSTVCQALIDHWRLHLRLSA